VSSSPPEGERARGLWATTASDMVDILGAGDGVVIGYEDPRQLCTSSATEVIPCACFYQSRAFNPIENNLTRLFERKLF
jgi:hypothetical protein